MQRMHAAGALASSAFGPGRRFSRGHPHRYGVRQRADDSLYLVGGLALLQDEDSTLFGNA